MDYVIGLIGGLAIGTILSGMIFTDRISYLEKLKNKQKSQIRNRDKFITKQMEINTNLQNNLRLVTNSLPQKIKRSYHIENDNF